MYFKEGNFNLATDDENDEVLFTTFNYAGSYLYEFTEWTLSTLLQTEYFLFQFLLSSRRDRNMPIF